MSDGDHGPISPSFVLSLYTEIDRLRGELADSRRFQMEIAERLAITSEILGRLAEREMK